MKFKMPHTLTLLFFLLVAALVATWIIPQGHFETEFINGREVVVPGTFQISEAAGLLCPLSFFTAMTRRFMAAKDIIFLLLFIGRALGLIRRTGRIEGLL